MTRNNYPRYLIALDLDGTLLNKDRQITPKTQKYLQKLQDEGHSIVITTGRPFRASIGYYNQLGLHSPMICYNGTFIINPSDSSFPITDLRFPKEVVKAILNNGTSSLIKNVMCETNEKIWINTFDEELSLFFWEEGMQMIFGNVLETLDEDPMTLILKLYERTPETETLLREKLAIYPQLKIRFWYTSSICETYFDGVSKGHAVLEVAKHLGIDEANIIAFGDADNDEQLLSMTTHSFGMKNGTSLALKNAKYITEKDHNEDAIYHELKAFFKSKK